MNSCYSVDLTYSIGNPKLIAMKSMICKILVFMVLTGFVSAQTEQWEVPIQNLPESVENYVALRNEIATTPGGGAALFVIAMIKYSENPQKNMDYFVAILVNDGTVLQKSGRDTYGGMEPNASAQFLIKRMNSKPYLPLSYISGTSPEGGYIPPSGTWIISSSTNPHSYIADDTVKVFIQCSGADTPRPVTLKRNNRGIWKVKEFSSLFVGIREPQWEEDDAL